MNYLLPLMTQQCTVVIIAVDVDTETLGVKCLAQGHTMEMTEFEFVITSCLSAKPILSHDALLLGFQPYLSTK